MGRAGCVRLDPVVCDIFCRLPWLQGAEICNGATGSGQFFMIFYFYFLMSLEK